MPWQLLLPHHWLTWVALGLYRGLTLLPHPVLMTLGRNAGRIAMRALSGRMAIAKRNIEACFPHLDAVEQRRLLVAHFESLGMGVMEVGMSWWWQPKKLDDLAEFDGLEYLEQAVSEGKGVLLFGAHFTSMEIGGRILADKIPLDVMYRRSNNPVVEYVVSRARGRLCRQLIQRNEVKLLVRSLKQGHVIWNAPDQNTQRKKAVFVDFFGHKTSTTPVTARLAAISGATVVPFRTIRKSGGEGYRLEFEAPLAEFPTGDLIRDTQRTTDIIAHWVEASPEQYLWIHRRFRTRPDPSDASFY